MFFFQGVLLHVFHIVVFKKMYYLKGIVQVLSVFLNICSRDFLVVFHSMFFFQGCLVFFWLLGQGIFEFYKFLFEGRFKGFVSMFLLRFPLLGSFGVFFECFLSS